jgi:hypothetical protein
MKVTNEELRDMIFGSQCRCGGFPTQLKTFRGCEGLFHKCQCGNYAPRQADQYAKLLKYDEEIQ